MTFLTRVLEHVFSIGYILWGKKKKPIDNVARFKELTIIKLYSKIDECRSKFNRMLVLAPSSGGQNQHDSGNELSSPGDDVLVTDWDRSRESLNGISEGKRGYLTRHQLPSHIIFPWDGNEQRAIGKPLTKRYTS